MFFGFHTDRETIICRLEWVRPAPRHRARLNDAAFAEQ